MKGNLERYNRLDLDSKLKEARRDIRYILRSDHVWSNLTEEQVRQTADELVNAGRLKEATYLYHQIWSIESENIVPIRLPNKELTKKLLKKLQERSHDPEANGSDAVDVLRNFLQVIGHADVVDEFDKVKRYY